MKPYVVKLLLFILPLTVFTACLELMLRHIPNDYKYKHEYLDHHSGSIETLILGSSHTFYGLDPRYFCGNTFNAAHVSQTLDCDYEVFNKYYDRLNCLKNVIIPVSYGGFFIVLKKSPESWRLKNYQIYYGINSFHSLTSYSEVLSNELTYNLKRLASYYVMGNSDMTCTNLGWGTSYHSENAKDLAETGLAALKRSTIDNIHSDESQKTFRETLSKLCAIIEQCDRKHIRVLLYTPPAYVSYRNGCREEQLVLTFKTLTDLASKYHNCTYLNLFADTMFIKKDFYDAVHLSETGARKLSEKLNNKLMN